MQQNNSCVKNCAPDSSSFGSKASTLLELQEKGFNVPQFFILTPDSTIDDQTTLQVRENFRALDCTHVAVRSSVLGEDGESQSFAGQFLSLLDVKEHDLLQAIEQCRASLHAPAISQYAHGDAPSKIAIIVQRMIVPEISGVAFSVNPVTSDRGQLIIESVLGNCSALVSGEVTPTHHCIEKNSIDPQASPSLIDKVAKITLEIESALGYPVDVEWAATQDTIHILQARRITTLSN